LSRRDGNPLVEGRGDFCSIRRVGGRTPKRWPVSSSYRDEDFEPRSDTFAPWVRDRDYLGGVSPMLFPWSHLSSSNGTGLPENGPKCRLFANLHRSGRKDQKPAGPY
jgi:hypothetical protein